VLFALGSGEIVVAQTSLIGFDLRQRAARPRAGDRRRVARGRRRPHAFSTGVFPRTTATLLFVSLSVIVVVGIAVASGRRGEPSRRGDLGRRVRSACLVVYGTWLWGYLRSDPARGEAVTEETTPAPSRWRPAVVLLTIAGVGAAFVSDWFIHALDPAVKSLRGVKGLRGGW